MRRKILKLERGNLVFAKKEEKKEEEYKNKKLFLKSLGSSLGFGFSTALSIVLAVFTGAYLDKKFNLYPVLTLAFVFFAVLIALYNILRIIKE